MNGSEGTTAIGCIIVIITTIATITAIIIPITLIILIFIFNILMLIDCIKNQKEQKELWIIIILFGNWLGATIYYFTKKKERKKYLKSSLKILTIRSSLSIWLL